MQDPFAPLDPMKVGKPLRTKEQQDFDRRLIEAFTPKAKQKAASQDPLEQAFRVKPGSLLPPGQENKGRKQNRQRLSKTWKALEGRGLSAQDLELTQSLVFMSMQDKDGKPISATEYHRDVSEFKPTLSEKAALDIVRDPKRRAEAVKQRDAWRRERRQATAMKEGRKLEKDTEPGLVAAKPRDVEGQSADRTFRIEQAFEKGLMPGLLTPNIVQDVRDELSHRVGKFVQEHGLLAQAEKLVGVDPKKEPVNTWLAGGAGQIAGGVLDFPAALEFAGDSTKPPVDRVMAAGQALLMVATSGAGGAIEKALSSFDVPRKLALEAAEQIGKASVKGASSEVKGKVEGILNDIRQSASRLDDADVADPLVVGKQEPPQVTREAQAAQEAELRARLEEPPVKGIPDEPETLPSPYNSKSVEPVTTTKEPWQMTRAEFKAHTKEPGHEYSLDWSYPENAEPWIDEFMVRSRAEAAKAGDSPEPLGWLTSSEITSLQDRSRDAALDAVERIAGGRARKVFPGYEGLSTRQLRDLAEKTDGLGITEANGVYRADYPDLKPVETPVQASTPETPPLTPEAPQNAVETPIKASDKAKQELSDAWEQAKKHLMDGAPVGANLPLTEGQLKFVGMLPELAVKGAKVAYHTVDEFVEYAVSHAGEWIRPHAQKAWDESHPQPKQEFGLSAGFEPAGRATSGFVAPDDLARRGQELVTADPGLPQKIYQRAIYDGQVSDDDVAAVAFRGTQIENRSQTILDEIGAGGLDDAEIGARQAELDALRTEMGSVLEVGDVAQKTFHRMGQALQVALRVSDYTPVRVAARAKAANYGDDLPQKWAEQFNDLSAKLKEAEVRAQKAEADAAKLVQTRAVAGVRSTDRSVKKDALLKAIKSDLGLDKYVVTAPGIKGKRAGAVSVPKNKQKAMTSYVNGLTRIYIEDGASTLDEVVKRFQADMPLLSREDVLGLLNKEYREAVLEADVHKLEIDRALRMVQENAKRERTSIGKRFVHESGDAVLSLQRQMQAGMDASLSFIQGLPGLEVSPSSWGKAWVPWFRTVFAKDAQLAMSRNNAMLHADPAFKFAKKAGVGFADVSGPYAVQEEVLIGHLAQKARESKLPVARQYFEILARSQEGGTAFLNKLRLELFKKFAAGNFKDEQTLKDAAMLANILTGRGSGAMADALSAKPFGYIAYSPRYTWSKYQNAALPLLLPAKITSKTGRKAAASAWTKQTAIGLLSVPFIAKSLGWDVETDLRSGEFGAMTLPNGGKLRLFKHFTEPLTTVAQISQGRFSRAGNFTEPGYGSTQIAGQYITGKGSPVFSTAWRQATNNRYDQELQKGVPFNLANPEDAKVAAYELFTPLSWQNMVESGKQGDWLGVFLGLMGIEYSPSKGAETAASGRR